MPSTLKGNDIYNNEVVFGILVHNATATAVPQGDDVFLKVADDPQPFFLPPGITIPEEYYGKDIDITVRDITHEVIMELEEDDVYEEDLEKSNRRILPVDNWAEIKRLYEECKIQIITRNSKSLSTCLAGVVLAIVSAYLYYKEFSPAIVPQLGFITGVLAAVFCLIKPISGLFKVLHADVIWDSEGNFINIQTGETNLNGGFKVPRHLRGDS